MKEDKQQIILEKSIQYFNEYGFDSVSFNELAKFLGMSRGNLTYHYKDKEALLEAISTLMWEKIELERAKTRQFPSFENVHNEIQLYFWFQREYSFIFLDTKVLQHPLLKERFRQMTAETIKTFQVSLLFAIRLGNLKPEPYPGMYNNIAFTTWYLTFFWLAQEIVRGGKKPEDGEKLVWNQLVPHFTEKGLRSFQEFFGEEYLETLGETFSQDIEQVIPF